MVSCTICGKSCKTLAGLSGHMQFKHPESEPVVPSTPDKPVRIDAAASSATLRRLLTQVQALKDELKALKDQPVTSATVNFYSKEEINVMFKDLYSIITSHIDEKMTEKTNVLDLPFKPALCKK